jgi:hypothetical protein
MMEVMNENTTRNKKTVKKRGEKFPFFYEVFSDDNRRKYCSTKTFSQARRRECMIRRRGGRRCKYYNLR